MKRVLINAANLHVGGGVQVAASLISEIEKLLLENSGPRNVSFEVVCSDSVLNNIRHPFNKGVFADFRLLNIRQARPVSRQIKDYFNGFDLCVTVFGPLYFSLSDVVHVCGFAQPWIAYPSNPVYEKLKFIERMKTRVKFSLQWLLFSKSDYLVVELEHVREALVRKNFSRERIAVIPNCVSALYFYPDSWVDLPSSPFFDERRGPTLGFLGRGYSHKNLNILLAVDDILREKYSLECGFLFTLDSREMDELGFSGRKNFSSVGTIVAAQCPSFYRKIDGLIFPSLLECFSATPIEAMAMKVPVFASDLPFVRDVCSNHVNYFDPLDSQDIARSIFEGFEDREQLAKKANLGYSHCLSLPNAADRAKIYLNLIERLLPA